MSKKFLFLFAAACSLILTSCGQSLAVSKKGTFEKGTGVIGVFRQPLGFCSGGIGQHIYLGGEKIVAKPTWTSDQDNLFSAYIDAGRAPLSKYVYGCGSTLTTLTPREEHGIVIPENGFCKIVISFLKGEKLYSQNDELLKKFFEEEDVAEPFDSIPYCETF